MSHLHYQLQRLTEARASLRKPPASYLEAVIRYHEDDAMDPTGGTSGPSSMAVLLARAGSAAERSGVGLSQVGDAAKTLATKEFLTYAAHAIGIAGAVHVGFSLIGLFTDWVKSVWKRRDHLQWLRARGATAVRIILATLPESIQDRLLHNISVSRLSTFANKDGLRALEQFRVENPGEFQSGVSLWKREGRPSLESLRSVVNTMDQG